MAIILLGHSVSMTLYIICPGRQRRRVEGCTPQDLSWMATGVDCALLLKKDTWEPASTFEPELRSLWSWDATVLLGNSTYTYSSISVSITIIAH